MSNMNKRLHDILYPILEKRQGKICIMCNKEKPKELFIDHIDNNNSNNDITNLQLLCRSCNTKKNHPRIIEPTLRNASPEFLAGKKNYRKAKKYVTGLLLDPNEHGALLLDVLIDDVANYVDCSQTQVKNYIKKMCSKRHGLMTTEERSNGIYLVWKNNDELDEVFKLDIVE